MELLNNKPFALVTGASSGLGRAFAHEFAKRAYNLVLVALPGGSTQSLARNLEQEYNITVYVYEFDLTDISALSKQTEHIFTQHNITFLVNNAGIGGTSLITETAIERIDSIIQLNVRSMVHITRMAIPFMTAQSNSYILNVASMAAFLPIAYKTVYPASKAFISSFSLGLRKELEDTGIKVSVVYPGPIMTNATVSRRIIGMGSKGKMGLLSTAEIASVAINKTIEGKTTIIPGLRNKLNHLLMKITPLQLQMNIVSQNVRKEIDFTSSVI